MLFTPSSQEMDWAYSITVPGTHTGQTDQKYPYPFVGGATHSYTNPLPEASYSPPQFCLHRALSTTAVLITCGR